PRASPTSSLDVLSSKVARHAAETCPRMGRRTDVIEAADDGPVIAAPGKRPPQMKLAERAGPRIRVAADEVDVVALEIGWRQHRGPYRRSVEVDHVATEPSQHALGIRLGEIRGPGAKRRSGDLVRRVATHEAGQLLQLNPEQRLPRRAARRIGLG